MRCLGCVGEKFARSEGGGKLGVNVDSWGWDEVANPDKEVKDGTGGSEFGGDTGGRAGEDGFEVGVELSGKGYSNLGASRGYGVPTICVDGL